MKTIPDLTNIETLEKFKEHLSEAVDKKIEEAKINERIESIDNMSVGELKNLFESIAADLFDENREVLGKYVKLIRENSELRTIYSLYESATTPNYTKNSESLVNTMVTLSESLDKAKLNEGKDALRGLVKEAVALSNITSEGFDTIVGQNKELNESLDYIFSTKANTKNLFEYTDRKDYVVNYINENMQHEEVETEGIDADPVVESYQKVFDGLELWESEVVKDLSLCQLSGSDGEEVFNKYKDGCLEIMNEKIESTENLEEKSRIIYMKEQLEKKKFNAEKLTEDVLKLSELKHTLEA